MEERPKDSIRETVVVPFCYFSRQVNWYTREICLKFLGNEIPINLWNVETCLGKSRKVESIIFFLSLRTRQCQAHLANQSTKDFERTKAREREESLRVKSWNQLENCGGNNSLERRESTHSKVHRLFTT